MAFDYEDTDDCLNVDVGTSVITTTTDTENFDGKLLRHE